MCAFSAAWETSPADNKTRDDDLVNLDDEWLEPQELPIEGLTCGYKYGFADTHSDLQALKVIHSHILGI